MSIAAPANSILDLTNTSFTVEFWARRAALTNGHYDIAVTLGAESPSSNDLLHMWFRSPDDQAANQFTMGFWANDLKSGVAYTYTEWHHWAGTYNYGTGARCIYRDGAQVVCESSYAAFQGVGTLKIGGNHPSNRINGSVDEVRVWRTVRTAAEIQANMYDQLTGTEPNLAGY